VVDASEYGFPQRRKRVFLLAHREGTPGWNALVAGMPPDQWLEADGPLARALPIRGFGTLTGLPTFALRASEGDDLADVSEAFNASKGDKASPFNTAGLMFRGHVWTGRAVPSYEGQRTFLGDVLVPPSKVDDAFVLEPSALERPKGWTYLKGGKKEERTGRDGFTYSYNEGPVGFPDALDRPSRTIITGEGGTAPSRFKHVVTFRPTKKQRERHDLDGALAKAAREALGLADAQWLRRLMPVELERLNGFPDDHTEGASDGRRAFFMGNALVCGVVKRIAEEICRDGLHEYRD